MIQKGADYPLDYTKGNGASGEDRARAMSDKATGQIEDAAASAHDMAAKVAEKARDYGEKAQEAAKNFKPYVEKSMKEQPISTLAVASVIGFVLGALWKK